MAKLMNKDPFTYQNERLSFVKALRSFHTNRGTPIARLPTIGGKEVDLFLLYSQVTALGGWEKVNELGQWEDLLGSFNLPVACPNSGHALKIIYIRYLEVYERIHFRPPDARPQYDENLDDTSSSHRRKSKPADLVPSTYNERVHMLSQAERKRLKLPPLPTTLNVVKKLEMALLSGLPNEADFAINVALLLSSEGSHTLQVTQSPYLIELLLAHVAIFKHESSLKDLHLEGWQPQTNRNYLRFWYESVEHPKIRNLIVSDSLVTEKGVVVENVQLPVSPEDSDDFCYLLNVKREPGIHDIEGQRVLQVATIIRNLSFEVNNMEFLASSIPLFRFLMLCVHNKYNSLKQLAFDTLGNMALKMVLPCIRNRTTQIILETISNCVASEDKFEVVSVLDMLARLCQVEANEDVLCDNLESPVFEKIVSYLTLHDIQLIVHTLEALYQLSELGEVTTTKIAAVNSAVDILVNLVSVEAQSFGPDSLMGIKVVELMPATGMITTIQPETNKSAAPATQSVPAPTPQKAVPTPQKAVPTPQKVAPAVAQTAPAIRPPAPAPPPPAKPAPPAAAAKAKTPAPVTDPGDALACSWMKAHYELAPGAKITKLELFRDYVVTCAKLAISNMVNIAKFQSLVRLTFNKIDQTYIDKPGGGKELLYIGIKKKVKPLPFPPPATDASSASRPPLAAKVTSAIPPSASAPISHTLSKNPAAKQLMTTPASPAEASSPGQYPGIQQALQQQKPFLVSSSSVAVVPTPPCMPHSSPVGTAVVPTSSTAIATSVSSTVATTLASTTVANQYTPALQTVFVSQAQHWQPQAPQQVQPVAFVPQQQQQPPQPAPGLVSPQHVATQPPTSVSESSKKSPSKSRKAGSSPPRAASPKSPKSPRAKSPKPPAQPKSPKPKKPASPKAKKVPESGTEPSKKSPKARKKPSRARKSTEGSGQGDLLQQAMFESDLFMAEDQTNEDATAAEGLLMCEPSLEQCSLTQGLVPEAVDSVRVNGGTDTVEVPQSSESLDLNDVPGKLVGDGKALPPTSLPQELLTQDMEPMLNGLSLPSTPCSVTSSIDSKDSEGSQPKDILKAAVTKALGRRVHNPKEEEACLPDGKDLKSQVAAFNGVMKHLGSNGNCSDNNGMPVEGKDIGETQDKVTESSVRASGNGDMGEEALGGQAVENGVPSPKADPEVADLKENQKVPAASLQVDGCGDDEDSDHENAMDTSAFADDEAATAVLHISGEAVSEEECAVSSILPPEETNELLGEYSMQEAPTEDLPMEVMEDEDSNMPADPLVIVEDPVGTEEGSLGAQGEGVMEQGEEPAAEDSNVMVSSPQTLQPQQPQNFNATGVNLPLPIPSVCQPTCTQAPSTVPSVQPQVANAMSSCSSTAVTAITGTMVSQVPVLPTAAYRPQLQPNATCSMPATCAVVTQAASYAPTQVTVLPQPMAPSQPGVPIVTPVAAQGALLQPQQLPVQMVTVPVSSSALPASSQAPAQYVQYFTPPTQYGQPQVAHVVSGGQVTLQQPAAPHMVPAQAQAPGQVILRPSVSTTSASSPVPPPPQPQPQMQVRFVTVNQNGQQIMHIQVPPGVQVQQYVQPAPTSAGMQPPTPMPVPIVQSSAAGQPMAYVTSQQSVVTSDGTQVVSAGAITYAVSQPPQTVLAQAPQASTAVQPQQPATPSPSTPSVAPAAVTAAKPAPPKRTRSSSPASAKKSSSKKKKLESDSTTNSAAAAIPTVFVYMCEWKDCKRCFASLKVIHSHVIKEHFRGQANQCVCEWEGCDGLRRQKWSLMTHLQDRHLSEQSLKAAAIKRQQQMAAHGSNSAASGAAGSAPPAPPVYPPDAAIQAIRRFNPKPPYPEFLDSKEGPVTKHVRLTAALILRNLARYSALGRSKIKRHETNLAYHAISSLEASSALNHCLWELHKPLSPTS